MLRCSGGEKLVRKMQKTVERRQSIAQTSEIHQNATAFSLGCKMMLKLTFHLRLFARKLFKNFFLLRAISEAQFLTTCSISSWRCSLMTQVWSRWKLWKSQVSRWYRNLLLSSSNLHGTVYDTYFATTSNDTHLNIHQLLRCNPNCYCCLPYYILFYETT